MSFLDTLKRHADAPDRHILDRELTAHMEHWFGPHEPCSARESMIEVRSIPPGDKCPFQIIHTLGMASKAMKTRKGQEPFAELLMVLPTEWSYGADREWPAREMSRFAEMFHEMSACLTEFVSVRLPGYPSPQPGTPFSGLMAVRPYFLPPAAHRLELSTGQTVHLYAVMPLSLVEMKYVATQQDPDALWSLAREQKRDPLELVVVDVRRPPVP